MKIIIFAAEDVNITSTFQPPNRGDGRGGTMASMAQNYLSLANTDASVKSNVDSVSHTSYTKVDFYRALLRAFGPWGPPKVSTNMLY